MNKEYKVSEKYLKFIKSEAVSAYIIFSFMIIILPPILFMDYWFIVLPIGLGLVPVWIFFRWKNYKKEICHATQSKLVITDSSIIFHYSGGKTVMSCQNPQRLDVNLKKGEIDSLLITIDKDNKVLISSYEKLDEIKNHFAKQVGELNVKQHRIFHKLK